MCQYYQEHLRPDTFARPGAVCFAGVVSGRAAEFPAQGEGIELPPDAANVIGFARLAALL